MSRIFGELQGVPSAKVFNHDGIAIMFLKSRESQRLWMPSGIGAVLENMRTSPSGGARRYVEIEARGPPRHLEPQDAAVANRKFQIGFGGGDVGCPEHDNTAGIDREARPLENNPESRGKFQ